MKTSLSTRRMFRVLQDTKIGRVTAKAETEFLTAVGKGLKAVEWSMECGEPKVLLRRKQSFRQTLVKP